MAWRAEACKVKLLEEDVDGHRPQESSFAEEAILMCNTMSQISVIVCKEQLG